MLTKEEILQKIKNFPSLSSLIGETGALQELYNAVEEYANQDKWMVINYDNPPRGEVLLFSTSGTILKGDWYENNLVTGFGWRTERSQWTCTEDGRNYLTLKPKEDITHWQPLPTPPNQ
jgi:hypothetical protein